jgi:hypothetical protein
MDPKILAVTLQVIKALRRDKHSSLLVPFISCKEKIVLHIQSLGPYSQHFLMSQFSKIVTLHFALKAYQGQRLLLMGPFLSYKENGVLGIQSLIHNTSFSSELMIGLDKLDC